MRITDHEKKTLPVQELVEYIYFGDPYRAMKELGISRWTLNRWVTGQHKPNPENEKKLRSLNFDSYLTNN